MAKKKYIVVAEKPKTAFGLKTEVYRKQVPAYLNDFQIGYEAGKLEKEFSEETHMIFLEKL